MQLKHDPNILLNFHREQRKQKSKIIQYVLKPDRKKKRLQSDIVIDCSFLKHHLFRYLKTINIYTEPRKHDP